MPNMLYGRMVPVRGLEMPSGREDQRYRYRKPESAIKDKLKVLEEFGIVDDRNEETIKRDMEKLLKDNPDGDLDRLLDGFARKLISKKLGG